MTKKSSAYYSYSSAAQHQRQLLGVQRLNSAQVNDCKAAVARHQERREKRVEVAIPPIERLRQKLRSEIAGEILPIIQRLYRQASSAWAGGKTEISIEISKEPIARGESYLAYSRNGKWSGKNAQLHISIMPSWRKYIGSIPGLAIAGGMLTTHAKLTEGEDRCWEANWICQGQGFNLKSRHGYIYQSENGFFHGRSIRGAKGAARRYREKQWLHSSVEVQRFLLDQKTQESLPENFKLADIGEIEVNRKDSILGGNCETGTDNWIERHFPGRKSATIAEIIAADPNNDRVTRAAAIAIRRWLGKHIS